LISGRLWIEEARANEDGLGVGGRTLAALLHGELGRTLEVHVIGVELEFEREASREVRDRRNGLKGLGRPCFMNRSKLSREFPGD